MHMYSTDYSHRVCKIQLVHAAVTRVQWILRTVVHVDKTAAHSHVSSCVAVGLVEAPTHAESENRHSATLLAFDRDRHRPPDLPCRLPTPHESSLCGWHESQRALKTSLARFSCVP